MKKKAGTKEVSKVRVRVIVDPDIQILKSKVLTYYQLQKLRMGLKSRLWMYEHKDEWSESRGLPPQDLTSYDKEVLATVFGKVQHLLIGEEGNVEGVEAYEGVVTKEEEAKREIERLGENTKIWVNWLIDVKGVAPFTAGVIQALLMDKDFPTRSHLKMYIGWGTDNKGHFLRKERGKKLNINHKLRSFFYATGERLVMADGDYHKYYTQQRAKIFARHPEMGTINAEGEFKASKDHPEHLHKSSIIKMVNLFLSHLWEEMFRIKHPTEPIPKPNHYRDKPLAEAEIIPVIRDKN
jgi:hypothetical protein